VAIKIKSTSGIAPIIVILLLCVFPNVQAQTIVTFSPADKFDIPVLDGAVSFAVNGSYSKSTFENNTWIFTDLQLNGSQMIRDFRISTQNSNVTIFSFLINNGTSFQSERLRFKVEGHGEQILNFGLFSEQGESLSSAEWTVVFGNHTVVSEGDGWNLLPHGTVDVTGATENVSIIHYNFLNSFGNNSNLPFYQQHSVAITIAISVSVVIIFAFVIKAKKNFTKR
jgi:spore coat protein U-like protein